MPRTFRTEIHGHIVEVRHGDLGGETVLLDGRVVSNKPFASFYNPSHFFELSDQAGRTHAVEARSDSGKLGLSSLVRILVDGADRGTLDPIAQKPGRRKCMNCGYSLDGLPTENNEVRCPECGRHTPSSMIA